MRARVDDRSRSRGSVEGIGGGVLVDGDLRGRLHLSGTRDEGRVFREVSGDCHVAEATVEAVEAVAF